jgi:hypothetical protein
MMKNEEYVTGCRLGKPLKYSKSDCDDIEFLQELDDCKVVIVLATLFFFILLLVLLLGKSY